MCGGWAFSGDRMGLASLESRTWSVERWVRNTRETQRNEEGSVWILCEPSLDSVVQQPRGGETLDSQASGSSEWNSCASPGRLPGGGRSQGRELTPVRPAVLSSS